VSTRASSVPTKEMTGAEWTIDNWREKARGSSIISSDPFGDTSIGIFNMMYSPQCDIREGQFPHGLYVQMLKPPDGVTIKDNYGDTPSGIDMIQQWSCPLVGWEVTHDWNGAKVGIYHGVIGVHMFSIDIANAKLDSSLDSLTVKIKLTYITPKRLSKTPATTSGFEDRVQLASASAATSVRQIGEAEEKETAAHVDEALLKLLQEFGMNNDDRTASCLARLGVKTKDDFQFLSSQDLLNGGLSLVSVRKIEKAVKLSTSENTKKCMLL
jgi:hypothetical protein